MGVLKKSLEWRRCAPWLGFARRVCSGYLQDPAPSHLTSVHYVVPFQIGCFPSLTFPPLYSFPAKQDQRSHPFRQSSHETSFPGAKFSPPLISGTSCVILDRFFIHRLQQCLGVLNTRRMRRSFSGPSSFIRHLTSSRRGGYGEGVVGEGDRIWRKSKGCCLGKSGSRGFLVSSVWFR